MASDDTFVPKTTRERLNYFFVTPWWRLAWFIGAIVWCVVLNVFYISGGAADESLGMFSILPIFAFAADCTLRARRLRDRVKAG